jgi:hypothetical protein
MRIMRGAILCSAGLLFGGADAFAPSFATPLHMTGQSPNIAMVSTKEVFGQLYEASPPVQKTMSGLPTPVAKGAGAALMAATGAAGFLLTPSRRLAVSAVGGGLTAAIGNIGRKRLEEERTKAAVPAVAALLAEGLQNVTPDRLASIMDEYGVPKKQFDEQLGELYLAFLSATLNSAEVQTAELSELKKLKDLLKLSPAQAGNQVYGAARQMFSRHRAYLEDTEPNDSKKLLEKFVFLAERIISDDESPEGYRYESLRLQKLFSLTATDWRSMAENAAIPFYEKALNSAVIDGQTVTAAQLQAVRASLGITEGCADGMHVEVFSKRAAGMLEQGRFSEADKAALTAAQELLAMDAEASTRSLVALTSPLYSSSFDETVGAIASAAAELESGECATQAGKLAVRMQELMLEPATAHSLEAAALRSKAKQLLDEAMVTLRAQNVPATLGAAQGLLAFCERAAGFMAETGHSTESDKEAALPALFSGLQAGLKGTEVLSLYRALLLHYLEDLKVDEQEARSLARMRAVLGLTDADEASVYQAAAGPIFRKTVRKVVGLENGELGDKAELDAAVADLALSPALTTQVCVDVYTERLKLYADDGKIINEEQAEKLSKLRDFLSIEMATIHPIHEELCAPAYLNSVREVMGTSGIIPDEYWDGLTQLQSRLCLSDEAAQALFAKEVTGKMKIFGDNAIEALQEKAKEQQQQQGQGNMQMEAASKLSTEIDNLVEFAVASKALVTKEVDGEEVEVIGASLRQFYEKQELMELYKQYLIEAFSGNDASKNEKVFSNLGRLALVLGLEKNEVTQIHNNIGTFIYRQYVSKALKKGPLGTQETQFLASIKDALGMEQERCDFLVRDLEVQHVSESLEAMFEAPSVEADDVRKMLENIDTYDVDLVEDLQINSFRLERMFLCMLEELVETGELKPDDMSALEDVCEPLRIDEETAAKRVEEVVRKRTSGGVLQAASCLRQGAGDAACKEMTRVIKFAALLGGASAETPNVSEGERNELYMVYQASMLADGDIDAEGKAQLEMLRAVMGLQPVSA